MPDTIDILKLRILICLLKMSPESCTVTNLAKTLATEKYAVSRAMSMLERESLLDRSEARKHRLTPSGVEQAQTLYGAAPTKRSLCQAVAGTAEP